VIVKRSEGEGVGRVNVKGFSGDRRNGAQACACGGERTQSVSGHLTCPHRARSVLVPKRGDGADYAFDRAMRSSSPARAAFSVRPSATPMVSS
jgi:hypothetical protein